MKYQGFWVPNDDEPIVYSVQPLFGLADWLWGGAAVEKCDASTQIEQNPTAICKNDVGIQTVSIWELYVHGGIHEGEVVDEDDEKPASEESTFD